MPEFYHDLVTEKSFKILQELKRQFEFTLIGGWAIYLYAKALKSKDIDIVVDYDQLEKIKKMHNISKNDRLKKYEIKIEEIDIDIYLPHYSELGLPAEEIKKSPHNLDGFSVPVPEILLILKIYTFEKRKGTAKGEKDLIDIFSLIKEGVIDWQKYKEIIKEHGLLEIDKKFKELIPSVRPISEIGLSDHQMSRLKKKVLGSL